MKHLVWESGCVTHKRECLALEHTVLCWEHSERSWPQHIYRTGAPHSLKKQKCSPPANIWRIRRKCAHPTASHTKGSQNLQSQDPVPRVPLGPVLESHFPHLTASQVRLLRGIWQLIHLAKTFQTLFMDPWLYTIQCTPESLDHLGNND